MFADPKQVLARRLRRRLKAGAAVALALVAGAFLACKGGGDPQPSSPNGPDARSGPGARGADDSGTPEDAAAAAAPNDTASDAANDAPSDAASDASAALTVPDGGVDAGAKAHKVDKHEHRKGMPVKDNLLE